MQRAGQNQLGGIRFASEKSHHGLRGRAAAFGSGKLDRGQGRGQIGRLGNIVHANHGHILRYTQAVVMQAAHGTNGHVVVGTQNGSGRIALGKHCLHGLIAAGLESLIADLNQDLFGKAKLRGNFPEPSLLQLAAGITDEPNITDAAIQKMVQRLFQCAAVGAGNIRNAVMAAGINGHNGNF